MSVWKGTPGPWERHVCRVVGDEQTIAIADLIRRADYEDGAKEAERNAKGIAALPRLVDALAALLQETIDQGGIGTQAMFEAHAALKDAGVEL